MLEADMNRHSSLQKQWQSLQSGRVYEAAFLGTASRNAFAQEQKAPDARDFD
jgi:hypothetical protein